MVVAPALLPLMESEEDVAVAGPSAWMANVGLLTLLVVASVTVAVELPTLGVYLIWNVPDAPVSEGCDTIENAEEPLMEIGFVPSTEESVPVATEMEYVLVLLELVMSGKEPKSVALLALARRPAEPGSEGWSSLPLELLYEILGWAIAHE